MDFNPSDTASLVTNEFYAAFLSIVGILLITADYFLLMNRHERRVSSRIQRTSNGPRAEAATVVPGTAEHLQDGVKRHQAGRLAEAEACYRRVLAAQPRHADAMHLLGVIAQQQGRSDLAVELIRQAIKQNEQAVYYLSLGNALRVQRQLDEAVAAHRQAIQINSDYAEAHFSLGNVMSEQGRLEEAAAAYRHAIRIKSDYAEAHCNLGAALKKAGKVEEAIAEYRQSLAINPRCAEVHCNLSGEFFDQGKLDEAIAASRQAITLKPDLAEAYDTLGMALLQLGHLSEARAALEQAVKLAPRTAKYRRDLGQIKHFAAGDPHLAEMEQLAQDSASLSVDDRIALHFALGKAYEDMGRRAEAFRQWLDGNALKRQQITYDEAATLGVLDRVRSVFTSELVRTRQNGGNPSPVPVFIIGMERSGSTLVEQIIASHPQVFGRGELKHFVGAVKGIKTKFGGAATYPELVTGMTDEDFRDLGARYLAEIECLAPDTIRVTDKMLRNFTFAGLIHLALPNAPIIHTIRDPVDTCLSCFSKLFNEGQNHTYDLAELGRYYRHYQALMAHWHRVLPPGRILDVRYEDVVADLEGQARRIIAHCGLNWDPHCLSFYQTQRPVRTASATQVRQPVYDSSIARWRAYEPFLLPLTAELESHKTASPPTL